MKKTISATLAAATLLAGGLLMQQTAVHAATAPVAEGGSMDSIGTISYVKDTGTTDHWTQPAQMLLNQSHQLILVTMKILTLVH